MEMEIRVGVDGACIDGVETGMWPAGILFGMLGISTELHAAL